MGQKKRILVIDDDPNHVTFITVLLEDSGYAATSAADGVEGLELARADPPGLILLDITMPKKSGVKFYREVRADPVLREIPVVMVTGVMKQFEHFIHTRSQVPPPDGYFAKPVDRDELLQCIARLLGD